MLGAQLKWIYRAWRYRLRLDPAEIRWLLANIQPGDYIIDIGAHKGAYTYWMALATGPQGRVIAFEPQASLAATLSELTSRPKYSHVTVEPLGLSDREGSLPLKVPGSSSPGASFEDTDHASGAPASLVPVTRLDTYVSQAGNPPVRLIKCDVEGHELKVFEGALGLLQRDRPLLVFECESRHAGDGGMRAVFDFLSSQGYRGYFFDRRGPRPLHDFAPEHQQSKPSSRTYFNNFLFKPAERAA